MQYRNKILFVWLCLFIVPAFCQELPLALYEVDKIPADTTVSKYLSERTGWKKIEEGQKPVTFKGDVIMENSGLTVIFRQGSGGIELYTRDGAEYTKRSILIPFIEGGESVKVKSIRLAEYSGESISLDVTFDGKGQNMVVGFALRPGLPAVKTKVRSGAVGIRVVSPVRLAVVPDFFADDLVLDARGLPAEHTEAMADNFLMLMQDTNEAIIAAIWDKIDRIPVLNLSGTGDQRTISSVDIFHNGGDIWVAILHEKGIWHGRDITEDSSGKILNLEWGPPFHAKWKANLPNADGSTDSWEMMWHPTTRSLWATAIGRYIYPVWIDGKEPTLVGHVELVKPSRPEDARKGPLVIYPVDRTDKTPTAKFTITDLLRNCLGVGPCEYIMDLAGQQVHSKGLYTCAVYDILMPIFVTDRVKEERHFIEKTLNDGLTFVMAIRGRIESFLKWGQEFRTWLSEQKKSHPEHADFIDRMTKIAAGLDERYARKKGAATADVAKWIEEYRPMIASEMGAKRGEQLITQIRDGVGGPQDDLVAECRIVVKNLRQAASLAAARDPGLGNLAREIRKRTHEILRNKFGHEGR